MDLPALWTATCVPKSRCGLVIPIWSSNVKTQKASMLLVSEESLSIFLLEACNIKLLMADHQSRYEALFERFFK